MYFKKVVFAIVLLMMNCHVQSQSRENKLPAADTLPFIQIIGIAQDAGYPQIGCSAACCRKAWENNGLKRFVVSFALVDPVEKKWWLFEATPDIKEQLHYFQTLTNSTYKFLPDGIFITHAHIGHYAGLMELGREAMNSNAVPIYVLEKMAGFLKGNAPWSQLVSLNNIVINQLKADSTITLTKRIHVKAFTVPHRDEFSETAGFTIYTSVKSYLFIPDINKWDKWNKNILEEVAKVDVALLDATFNSGAELPNRNMKDVPHPLILETVDLFEHSDRSIKNKIYFIHFNHTNPILWDATEKKLLQQKGFNVAEQGMKL